MKLNALIVLVGSFAALAGAGSAAAQSAASAPTPPTAATAKFEAGKHYLALTPAQATSSDKGKIEVAEVFMFGCPHCFAFEPHLQDWLKNKPSYVSFVRLPAAWNAVAELHARAYYTAQALGKEAEIDAPFFDEYHVKHNALDSEDKLAAFFARFGVDDKTFRTTFNSFEVDAKVSRAQDLIRRYKVGTPDVLINGESTAFGTPAVVVNGKYTTSGSLAGTYDTWFAIIDEVVAKEHAGSTAAH